MLSAAVLHADETPVRMLDPGAGKAAKFVREIGEKLRPTLRGRDLPAFYDEHTLALLLPSTPLTGAEIAGRRLRAWLESATAEIDGDAVNWRFTLAVAERTDQMETPAELGRAAEDALGESTAVVGR